MILGEVKIEAARNMVGGENEPPLVCVTVLDTEGGYVTHGFWKLTWDEAVTLEIPDRLLKEPPK